VRGDGVMGCALTGVVVVCGLTLERVGEQMAELQAELAMKKRSDATGGADGREDEAEVEGGGEEAADDASRLRSETDPTGRKLTDCSAGPAERFVEREKRGGASAPGMPGSPARFLRGAAAARGAGAAAARGAGASEHDELSSRRGFGFVRSSASASGVGRSPVKSRAGCAQGTPRKLGGRVEMEEEAGRAGQSLSLGGASACFGGGARAAPDADGCSLEAAAADASNVAVCIDGAASPAEQGVGGGGGAGGERGGGVESSRADRLLLLSCEVQELQQASQTAEETIRRLERENALLRRRQLPYDTGRQGVREGGQAGSKGPSEEGWTGAREQQRHEVRSPSPRVSPLAAWPRQGGALAVGGGRRGGRASSEATECPSARGSVMGGDMARALGSAVWRWHGGERAAGAASKGQSSGKPSQLRCSRVALLHDYST